VVDLSALEYKLLAAFAGRSGRVLTRAKPRRSVGRGPLTDVVDNQVNNLRKRPSRSDRPRYLAALRGLGYRFDGEASDSAPHHVVRRSNCCMLPCGGFQHARNFAASPRLLGRADSWFFGPGFPDHGRRFKAARQKELVEGISSAIKDYERCVAMARIVHWARRLPLNMAECYRSSAMPMRTRSTSG
jgi:hypothetical protein